MPPVAGQEVVGFGRPAVAGRISGGRSAFAVRSRVEQRLNDTPAVFDLLGTLEQRRITDHAVVDQRLVARARSHLEVFLVVEPHLDAADVGDVTLVCAPAGFGKTSLLADWARTSTDVDTEWVVVDAYDNEAHREPAMRQTLLSWYPNAKLTQFQEGGHYPMQEVPVLLASTMEAFF